MTTDVFLSLTPVYVGFLCGIVLRQFGVFSEQFAKDLLRLVFYLLAPAFIFQAVSQAFLDVKLLAFFIGGVAFLFVGYAITFLRPSFRNMDGRTKAVAIMTSMTVNDYFTLPFVQAIFGETGIAKWAAYDLGNSLLTYSWVYLIAARHGSTEKLGYKAITLTLLKAPPLYALLAGLLLNFLEIELPTFIDFTATSIGSLTGLVTIIALGMLFTPQLTDLAASIKILVPRFLIALFVTFVISFIFRLDQQDLALLLMITTAPVAFLTIVYATLEDLDLDFAVRTVSLSLLFGVPITSSIVLLLL